MEKYQFKIEGVIVDTPEGWQDFELRLKRDDDIAGLLVSSTNRFTFWGDGYDSLKDRFDANYNDKVNVSIDILNSDKTYDLKYKGVVILTDASFNLEKRFVEATVEDANFQGAIQGNKNVKTFLNAGLTKNGENTASLTVYDLDYFNAAGTYLGLANREAFLLKDALDFLVRFMTDDEVKGIQSAYLDDVNNFEGASLPYITTGIGIRLASQDAPNVSFKELITFLQRTHDLTFDFVTDSGGNPVMRIEEKAFFFSSSNQDTFRSITDLKVKVDAQRVYSHIEVGNNTVRDAGNCSSTTRWFTFQKEDYALRGKGNIDKLLDLTTDFITDSNAIRTTTIANNFDDNIIIVLGNVAGTQATKFITSEYCSGNAFYNQGFTNDQIINRQIQSIPNSVTKYLTAADTPAKAVKDQLFFNDFGQLPVVVSVPLHREYIIPFSNEIYDLGGNYNDTLPETFYDVPFPGDFSFEANVQITFLLTKLVFNTTTNFAVLSYRLAIQRWDSTFNNLKEQANSDIMVFGFVDQPEGALKLVDRNIVTTMTCATSDRVVVRIIVELIQSNNIVDIVFSVPPSPINFFKCLGAAKDAGTFKVFDPNSFKARKYTFEKNVSLSRTDGIRSNTRSSIVINESDNTDTDKITWIDEMVNNIETGATSFIMIK